MQDKAEYVSQEKERFASSLSDMFESMNVLIADRLYFCSPTWWSIKKHMPEGSAMSSRIGSDSSKRSDVVVHLLGQHNVAEVSLDCLSALLPRAHFAATKEPPSGSLPHKLGCAQVSANHALLQIVRRVDSNRKAHTDLPPRKEEKDLRCSQDFERLRELLEADLSIALPATRVPSLEV